MLAQGVGRRHKPLIGNELMGWTPAPSYLGNLAHPPSWHTGPAEWRIHVSNAVGVNLASSPEKANVLLVDDRPANLTALSSLLDDLGYNLVKAQSGREALDHLRKMPFAVVLLDVRMPEMDGF